MRSSVVGRLIAVLGLLVALCAWLFPFQPIRPSPFDKTPNAPSSPPAERGRNQAQDINGEPNRLLGGDASNQSKPESLRRSESQAVINDPDGYTNVRSGPGTHYGIVARVVDGEIFYVVYQQGSWWQGRTK